MSKTRKLFGTFFKAPNSMTENEVLGYANYVKELHSDWIPSLALVTIRLISDNEVDIKYQFKEVPTERVNRGVIVDER